MLAAAAQVRVLGSKTSTLEIAVVPRPRPQLGSVEKLSPAPFVEPPATTTVPLPARPAPWLPRGVPIGGTASQSPKTGR